MIDQARNRDELAPGDHACLLYKDEHELAAVARAVWQHCLRCGWRFLYIARVNTRTSIEAVFSGEITGTAGQRAITDTTDPEFHRNFSTAEKAGVFLRKQTADARAAGFSALCIMREVPPIPMETHSSQRLASDTAGLEVLLRKQELVLVCGYQAGMFPASVLQDVLRTHPVAVIGTEVVKNLFYIPAEDARRYQIPSIEVRHWIQTLLDLKAAGKALEQTEALYRDLLDNASDMVQSVSPDGKFLYVNRAWKEALGYTDEEVGSLTLLDIVDPSSLDHCQAAFRDVTSGKKVERVKAVFRGKSGQKIPVEGNVNCAIADGKPTHTRGIFRRLPWP